jgi:A/G-specific adenine glycosylase
MEPKDNKLFFRKWLLNWNLRSNNRVMPWKGEKDPYRIWLSEIMLQQTRVEQGWGYYDRFIKTFPNIHNLAGAPEERVFKLWEGLGYYTRCKNLIASAKFISKERKGKFPDSYEEILLLKGVGPYTAAAIASFAFNLPHAVIDGNVFRVLARFFGIETATDSTAGKTLFSGLAQELLDKKQPGIYNQAIMDFGAVICRPQNPLCVNCPFKSRCVAFLQDRINTLPVKTGKIKKRNRWFHYLVIEQNGKLLVRKRAPRDIWENLYEFLLIEADRLLTTEELMADPLLKKIKIDSIIDDPIVYRQQLTHQTIQGRFVKISIKGKYTPNDYNQVTYKELDKLPFPRFITMFLEKNP